MFASLFLSDDSICLTDGRIFRNRRTPIAAYRYIAARSRQAQSWQRRGCFDRRHEGVIGRGRAEKPAGQNFKRSGATPVDENHREQRGSTRVRR